MKLCDVPRETKIRVLDNISIPLGAPIIKIGDVLFFHNLDTMYSYCETEEGQIVHLSSLAEVEII